MASKLPVPRLFHALYKNVPTTVYSCCICDKKIYTIRACTMGPRWQSTAHERFIFGTPGTVRIRIFTSARKKRCHIEHIHQGCACSRRLDSVGSAVSRFCTVLYVQHVLGCVDDNPTTAIMSSRESERLARKRQIQYDVRNVAVLSNKNVPAGF